MISSVTIGALCAALIGATATLLGLLIAKENKTSEFRQAWIDSLRDEICQFLVQFNAIYDATHARYGDLSSKLTVLSPLYANLNEAAFKISLRINPDESEGQAVLAALNELQKLSVDEETIKSADIRPLEADLLMKSKALLKIEWGRVKSGEPVFRTVKWLALVITPLLLIAVSIGGWIAFAEPNPRDREQSSEVVPSASGPAGLSTGDKSTQSTPPTGDPSSGPPAPPSTVVGGTGA